VSLPAGPVFPGIACACLVVMDGWGIAPAGPGNGDLAHNQVVRHALTASERVHPGRHGLRRRRALGVRASAGPHRPAAELRPADLVVHCFTWHRNYATAAPRWDLAAAAPSVRS
jgi:hypothetical protein